MLTGAPTEQDPASAQPRQTESAFTEFAALYQDLYPALAGYCHGLLASDRELAEDTAQEAFVRLLSRLTAVREPRPWLYLVATNLCRDHWRRQARNVTNSRREELVTPESAEAQAMRDLVTRLPDRLMRAALLHYYADLSVEEVARTLNKPVGTVKRYLHEARAHLRNDMEADA